MTDTDFFYPEIHVGIGNYSFSDGVELEVHSSQSSYFDWAKVKFTDRFSDKILLKKRDETFIQLGYGSSFESVFYGYVPKTYGEINQNEILLKDHMLLLEDTVVTNTFLDASPQEIISYVCKKAGVKEIRLSKEKFQNKKRITVSKKSGIEVIQEVNFVWKIKKTFFFQTGVFYWGVKPEQSYIYFFEYGVNIISLERTNGFWELVTISAPFIKHSHLINVEHPDLSGKFEVKKVVFTTNESGFIRSTIYF